MPGRTDLAEAVARNLFKLMAIKDEYEVARLWTDGSFLRQLGQEFERWDALEVHLAPPLLAERDAITGHQKKRRYGPWMLRAMRLLRPPEAPARHCLRPVRPHRRAPDGAPAAAPTTRRCSTSWSQRLDATNHATAVELARVPEQIRGFGHVKEASVQRAKAAEAALLDRWRAVQASPAGGRIADLSRAELPHQVLGQPAAVGVLAADRAGQARLAALDHAGLAGERAQVGAAGDACRSRRGEGADRAGVQAGLGRASIARARRELDRAAAPAAPRNSRAPRSACHSPNSGWIRIPSGEGDRLGSARRAQRWKGWCGGPPNGNSTRRRARPAPGPSSGRSGRRLWPRVPLAARAQNAWPTLPTMTTVPAACRPPAAARRPRACG